jgi:hypothetical protein
MNKIRLKNNINYQIIIKNIIIKILQINKIYKIVNL